MRHCIPTSDFRLIDTDKPRYNAILVLRYDYSCIVLYNTVLLTLKGLENSIWLTLPLALINVLERENSLIHNL